MLSMQEFGFYDEVPVAFAKTVRLLQTVHTYYKSYDDSAFDLLSTPARELMFIVADKVREKTSEAQASMALDSLVLSFGFDLPDDKQGLTTEIKRLNSDLVLCCSNAGLHYENEIGELKTGIAELAEKFLDRNARKASGQFAQTEQKRGGAIGLLEN